MGEAERGGGRRPADCAPEGGRRPAASRVVELLGAEDRWRRLVGRMGDSWTEGSASGREGQPAGLAAAAGDLGHDTIGHLVILSTDALVMNRTAHARSPLLASAWLVAGPSGE